MTVQNGVATIEGKTNVVQHKGVATRLAKTGGALAVKNNIQISEAAKEKAAAHRRSIRTGDAKVAHAAVVQPAGRNSPHAAQKKMPAVRAAGL